MDVGMADGADTCQILKGRRAVDDPVPGVSKATDVCMCLYSPARICSVYSTMGDRGVLNLSGYSTSVQQAR